MHHPDRHAGAPDMERREQERRFKEVGEAYGVLSDPKKRVRYDHGQDFNDDGSSMAGMYILLITEITPFCTYK